MIASSLVLATGVPAQGQQGGAAPDRGRLIELQREAARLLKEAARQEVPEAEAARNLATASERLASLAADRRAGDARVPPKPGASSTPGERGPASSKPDEGGPLSQDVRDALRAAAEQFAAAAAAHVRSPDSADAKALLARARADSPRVLALLERVRAQLEGEVALGLSFQGSYSQSPVKETVYGGHASAMGPAPTEAPTSDQVVDSPVTFVEAAQLPVKTFSGGPTKDHILESVGNGVALLDYDGDGLLDIYFVTAAELTPARQRVPHRNALYRNLGGWKFEDVSARAGVDAAAWGNGVCAGDVDGDGRLDLYVTNWGPNFLFRNRGDGTFEETAARAGVAAGGWSTGCSFFDADGDGDLDLYVARYVQTTWDDVLKAQRTLLWRNGPHIMVGPKGLPPESDLFFENTGGGRFVESTAAHGLTDPGGYGFDVLATDYDDDGRIDLLVANDTTPNFLYHNIGNGRFESVGLASGVGVNGEGRAQAGMGLDAGDYDGDGRLDFVLTAFAHDNDTLFHGIDGRQFEDVSGPAGLAASTFVRMGWGTAFLDADLDGWLDLFFANGHIFADIDRYPQLGETFAQKNQLFINREGRFVDVSERAGAGLQVARVSRGMAIGDLDNDGDLDIVVSNIDATPTLLENRQQTGHHWIGFRVTAPGPNPFAIGAKVTIEAGGRRQIREIRSGGTFLSQSDLRPLFGLGAFAGPVSVDVRMPGGARWRWQDLAVDQRHELRLTDKNHVE